VKFILSQTIDKAMRGGGFFGAVIYGSQRLGKSSYAAQVLYELYGDWDVVNEHILFELEDVVRLLHQALKAKRKIPALVWDDAGIHANKLLYFQNRLLVQYLQNLLDVVGLNLGGLLITTPSPNNLLAAIRGYEWYRVKIYRRDDYNGRFAVGYQSVLLPSGSRLIKRVFKDNYNVKLPEEFWTPYVEKRQGYLEAGIEHLQNLIEKRLPGLSMDEVIGGDNHEPEVDALLRAERTPGMAAVSQVKPRQHPGQV